MGMFDYVVPECELPDEAGRLVREWQTKDFDAPFMDTYRITAEGRLMEEVYHIEDRSDKNAPEGSVMRLLGIMTKVHEGWRDANFHGVLNFYGSTSHDWKGEWIEYNATFTHGALEKIERVPPEEAAKP